MKNILFDIETNGLLDELDRVHSLVMLDIDTGEMLSCADQEGYTPIEVGLKMLQDADLLIGHNIQAFDIPAIEKVYGVSLNA
tara:strand:- start:307 stop:552 length:246 start_codon:yes stop_codon:yes gene_type:complete